MTLFNHVILAKGGALLTYPPKKKEKKKKHTNTPPHPTHSPPPHTHTKRIRYHGIAVGHLFLCKTYKHSMYDAK